MVSLSSSSSQTCVDDACAEPRRRALIAGLDERVDTVSPAATHAHLTAARARVDRWRVWVSLDLPTGPIRQNGARRARGVRAHAAVRAT